jgi:methylenetetrahydrofolate dehydrogenase (NADP+)/methenyltetrahydrofolate cyclohydrolase
MLQACGNIRKNRLGSDIEIIRNKTPVGRKHVIGFIVSEKTVRKQGGIAEGLNAQDYKCGQENDAGKESGAEEPVSGGWGLHLKKIIKAWYSTVNLCMPGKDIAPLVGNDPMRSNRVFFINFTRQIAAEKGCVGMITPLILDGKTLSKTIEAQLKIRVDRYRERCAGEVPTLATILVGGDPSSATYVKMKGSACARVGMGSRRIHLGDATTTTELIDAIDTLNEDRQIQGILLQHPVPSQINERIAFDRIAPEKDVDGVTCLGFGRMAMNEPAFGSATPSGIIRLMQHYGIAIEGKRAVVVGRSAILGKPMALMLLNLNATVTICHSRTTDLPHIIREADIVIGAVGKPKFIRGEWIRQGATLIDAGYHPGGIGDIDLESAIPHCSAYTPVPGGVGPMTIAALLIQTMDAAERAVGLNPTP